MSPLIPFLWRPPAAAAPAIAFDTATGAAGSGSATRSWSHTCTGSDLILLVGTGCNSGTVSSITYGGTGLTKIANISNGTVGEVELWGLVGPPAGTATVLVTNSVPTYVSGISASYTGVNQSALPSIHGTSTANNPLSVSLTTTVDKSWLVLIGKNDATVDVFSSGTNGTDRYTPNGGITAWGDTNGPKSPAGTYAVDMNCKSNVAGAACVLEPA